MVAILSAGCDTGAVQLDDPRAVPASPAAGAVFTEITERLPGNAPPSWPAGTYGLPEIMQGGAALLDHDGDGDLDILHVRVPPPGAAREPSPNRLYSREADGTYRDATLDSGLGDPGFGQGVAVGDVDNDGDVDVYVANFGPDAFYRNDGSGRFTDDTQAAGFDGERWSTGAVFCDVDRDGWLDLYVVHYVRYTPETYCQDEAGRQEYCGPQMYHGEPDRLYRNRGDGTFADVTADAKLLLPEGGMRARGLGAVCADFTADGWPDLFVANDGESNQLWVNRGDGTFAEEAVLRGVAVNREGKPEASMGIAVGDLDADAMPDLFVTHLFREHNTLYASARGPLFLDRTIDSQLAQYDYETTGFGCGFLDYDHDGDLDLAIANGRVRRGAAAASAGLGSFWNDYAEPNFLFENDGAGRFEDASDAAGRFATESGVGRGLAFGDLDDDGDVDLVLTNADNSIRVFRNDAPPPDRHWLRVRAVTRGRDALGARLRLASGGMEQVRFVLAGYSYGSSNDPRAHFGLGNRDRADWLEVVWPDGGRERFPVGDVDREITVVEGGGA